MALHKKSCGPPSRIRFFLHGFSISPRQVGWRNVLIYPHVPVFADKYFQATIQNLWRFTLSSLSYNIFGCLLFRITCYSHSCAR